MINGFARGQFQVAQLRAAEVLDLCNRVPDRCPVVVLVLDASEGGDQLAVHKSVPSIAALKGGRVAVTFSTLGPYVLHLALQRRRVQAAATYPPFSEAITKAGHSRVLFTSRETPGEILDLLVVEQRLLQHQPLLLGKLIRVWERAHREARTTPKTSVAWMAGREGITPEDFRRSEAGLLYFSLQEQRKPFCWPSPDWITSRRSTIPAATRGVIRGSARSALCCATGCTRRSGWHDYQATSSRCA